MKKNKKWFLVSFVSFAILSVLTEGCASTPKVVQTVPTYIGTNTPPTEPSPYRFSQEPAKRVIKDDGREYQAHVRALQRQPQAEAPVQQVPKGPTFTVDPYGVVRLAPTQPMVVVPVATSGWNNFTPQPTYTVDQYGVTRLAPTGCGSGGFGGGFGNGFGSVPITPGTFRSTVRADWGPVQNGALGKTFRFLTRGEDFPGYRHTGGPATVVRTYSAGGQVVAGGGFTSGLSFGWRR